MADRRTDTILVIGLGSPIMTDDAIGLEVVEEIESMHMADVETRQEAIGGLDIIPQLWGYKRVVIVDAIMTQMYEPGTIMFFNPDDFEETIGDASEHDINLATAMRIGREMEPEMMPDEVCFVAIEAEDIGTVNEGMTPKLVEAKPSAVKAVLHQIERLRSQSGKA
jgi:hydrogenase maturation protease